MLAEKEKEEFFKKAKEIIELKDTSPVYKLGCLHGLRFSLGVLGEEELAEELRTLTETTLLPRFIQ